MIHVKSSDGKHTEVGLTGESETLVIELAMAANSLARTLSETRQTTVEIAAVWVLSNVTNVMESIIRKEREKAAKE